MNLILNHHHLNARTPNRDRVSSFKSSLEQWASEQLPVTLEKKLSQPLPLGIQLSDESYICIRKLHIKLLLKTRHGMMQKGIERWAEAIVSAIMSSLTTVSSDNLRYFRSEAEYIAHYIRHVLAFNRAVDWPFEPHYDQHLSAVDNCIGRLVEKASLMSDIFQELRKSDGLSRVLNTLNRETIEQLLHALGAPKQIEVSLSTDLDTSIFEDFCPHEVLSLDNLRSFYIFLLAANHYIFKRKSPPTNEEWQALFTFSQVFVLAFWNELPADIETLLTSEQLECDSSMQMLFTMAQDSEVRKRRLDALLSLTKSITEKMPAPSIRPNKPKLSFQSEKRKLVEIRYGGLCFVIAALLRHPLAENINGELLWFFCCHAVPSDFQPLAISDQGLRNLCLGNVVWEEGRDIYDRVVLSEGFKRFCLFERIETNPDVASETIQAFVMHNFSQFLTGFEKTTAEGLFYHFLDVSAEFDVQSKALQCRVEKMPLSVVLSLSLLIGEQPELPCWPNKDWSIQWKS